MNTETKPDSPAIKLMRLVRSREGHIPWMTLNHSMLYALRLAIGSRMRWELKDLEEISRTMRPGFWLGEWMWEPIYAFSIACDSTGFVKLFEVWRNREPYFGNDVMMGHTCGYSKRNDAFAKRGRLALGFSVGTWRQKVTSINNERIVISEYEGEARTLKRILKLDHTAVRAMFPSKRK